METAKIVKRGVKTNGCSFPLHPFQIVSFLVIALDSYAFYFINIVTFSYSPTISILLGISFTLVMIVMFYYATRATLIDPSDSIIQIQREAKVKG